MDEKIPIWAVILCARCGCEFIKTNGRKRFCTPCGPIAQRERVAERCRERRAEDPEGMRAKQRAWYEANREHVAAYNKAAANERHDRHIGESYPCPDCGEMYVLNAPRRVRCPDCSKAKHSREAVERAKRWNVANNDLRNERFRERYATDPKYKLDVSMANGIGDSLSGAKGGRSWTSLVDYSLDQLKSHIERQFSDRMTWDNWGRWPDGWHIDHIVPRSSFSYTTAEDPEFLTCWGLTNLRPLWAVDNLKKSGKRLFLL